MFTLTVATLLCSVSGAHADADPRRTRVVEVFEQARDAVVNISTTRVVPLRSLAFGSLDEIFRFGPRRFANREVHSVGSGVVVHPDGFIVTNAHVVAQAEDINATFADGVTLEAEVIAEDPEHDLAVLRVRPPAPLDGAALGQPGDILIGETVIAIGNPLGLSHTVTTGIVSAVNRELQFAEGVYSGLLQTDAPINPGNSGGPLLNVRGELIGINTAIRGDAQNIGFAIPVARLWELLPELLNIERRQRVSFGAKVVGGDAARVKIIKPGTPAARAGLAANDVVRRVNQRPVANAIDFYVQLIDQSPGQRIAMRVERDGMPRTVNVELEPLPLPDGQELAQRLLGVRLAEVPRDLRRRYRLPDDAWLLVESVERRSPADRAGVEPGDVILGVNGVRVRNLDQVGLMLEDVEAGTSLLLTGRRLRPSFSWNVQIKTRQPS